MAKKKKAPSVPLSRDELASLVQNALLEAGTLTQSALLKKLPKAEQANGLVVLQELAAHGDVFRLTKGKTASYFGQDPIAKLERLVPRLLEAKPLNKAELQQAVEGDAPGHGPLLAEWLKRALAQRTIFEQATPPKTPGGKTYGTKAPVKPAPDLKRLLKKSLAALLSEVRQTDAAKVSRDAVIAFLSAELGLEERPGARNNGAPPPDPARDQLPRRPFLDALERLVARRPNGALISIRELRASVALDKPTFDETALALSNEQAIVLHHHDHPGSLPEAERQLLVKDARGTHYVGIALWEAP
jgi:hypothetical protein